MGLPQRLVPSTSPGRQPADADLALGAWVVLGGGANDSTCSTKANHAASHSGNDVLTPHFSGTNCYYRLRMQAAGRSEGCCAFTVNDSCNSPR